MIENIPQPVTVTHALWYHRTMIIIILWILFCGWPIVPQELHDGFIYQVQAVKKERVYWCHIMYIKMARTHCSRHHWAKPCGVKEPTLTRFQFSFSTKTIYRHTRIIIQLSHCPSSSPNFVHKPAAESDLTTITMIYTLLIHNVQYLVHNYRISMMVYFALLILCHMLLAYELWSILFERLFNSPSEIVDVIIIMQSRDG